MKFLTLALLLASVGARATDSAPLVTGCEPLRAPVATLLDLYGRKDVAGLGALLDGPQVLVLGSDLSERADTPARVAALLADDFALWQSAAFEAPAFMDCRVQAGLGTAAFDAPLRMTRLDGSTLKVTVRFLTVWRRSAAGWRLTQSMNSTPTVGASARELLQGATGR